MNVPSRAVLALATVIGLAALTPGCATKKFVLGKLNPLNKRVDDLETTSKEHDEDIAENSRTASHAEELGQTAGAKADAAAGAAEKAQQTADTATHSADQANTLAANNRQDLGELATRLDHINDLEMVGSQTVLFRSGSSVLDADSRAKLDALARMAPADRPYLVEVQGFTDSTGSAALNLRLSGRRADSVVRYLVENHNVPLRSVHTLGMGEDQPTAENTTRVGRQQNRRVEVKMYTLKQTQTTAKRVD